MIDEKDIEKWRGESFTNLKGEQLKDELKKIKDNTMELYKKGYITLIYNYGISDSYEVYIINKKEYFVYNYMKGDDTPITLELLAYDMGIKKEEVKDALKFLIEQDLVKKYTFETIEYYVIARKHMYMTYKISTDFEEEKIIEKEIGNEYMMKILDAKQNKIISLEEIKKLKEDINELESKTYGNILVFLGIFISIFSLISININFLDILKDLNMYEKISLISVVNLVTVISIYALIGLIEIVKRPKTKDSKFPTGVVVIIIILSLIFIISTGLASKENKVDAEKTESQKNIYTIEVTGKIDKEIINILEKLNGTNNIKIVPKENKVDAEKTESQKNIYTIEVTGKIDKETINILEKLNGTNNIKIVPKEK